MQSKDLLLLVLGFLSDDKLVHLETKKGSDQTQKLIKLKLVHNFLIKTEPFQYVKYIDEKKQILIETNNQILIRKRHLSQVKPISMK